MSCKTRTQKVRKDHQSPSRTRQLRDGYQQGAAAVLLRAFQEHELLSHAIKVRAV